MAIFMAFQALNVSAKVEVRAAEIAGFEISASRAARIIEDKIAHIAASFLDFAIVINRAEATGASSTAAFHDYAQHSHFFDEFPTLMGVGVVTFAEGRTLGRLSADLNRESSRDGVGYGRFVPQNLSDGPTHALLTMFEPLSADRRQDIGKDLLSGPLRSVYLDAIKTKEMRLSLPFDIGVNQHVIALISPFTTASGLTSGAIGSVFEVPKFLEAIHNELAPLNLAIEIVDVGDAANDDTNHQPQVSLAKSGVLAPDFPSTNSIMFRRSFKIGGRIWQLDMRPKTPLTRPWAIDSNMFMAVIIALLSGLLIYRMNRTSELLGALVAKRTGSLKLAVARLDHERKLAQDAATHDALTGLLNQRGLEIAHEQHFARSIQSNEVALLSIDLDRFKEINDTSGYEMGNSLIIFVSEFLTNFVSDKSLIARFGGDEFLIFAEISPHDARKLANDIVMWSNQPQTVGDTVVRFGASIGIAFGHSGNANINELIADANISLSAAKTSGRGRYCVFDEEIKAQTFETKRLADELRRALEDDEFEPYFQTQHSAHDYSVSGVECLIRWRHPSHGILAPAAFLDIAEAIGILGEIDAIALRKSVDAVVALEGEGLNIPKVSVNVSIERLRDPELLFAIDCLPEMRAQLTFEILETVFIDELDSQMKDLLETLENRGIGIEIDDFGSGRASILGLTQLEPSRLKIDRALVMPLLDRPEQKELLKSIVAMGRSLRIGVTAEGVETLAHAKILREIGVDTLQGYYFCEPMPFAMWRAALQAQAA